MLTIDLASNRVKLAKTHERWFYRKPLPTDAFSFATYYNCQCTSNVWGFRRKPKFTFLVDLNQTGEEILNTFNKTTRSEVRRAEKDGVRSESGLEQNAFRDFFDQFARGKDREPLAGRELKAYWPHFLVTQAVLNDEILVMHSYLLDRDSRRASLRHSASQFREANDSAKRNQIGRANRFLHFEDMMLLQKQGFSIYDLGGCSPDTTDPELANIHQFKASFGGKLTEESTFVSAPLFCLGQLKGALSRNAKPAP